jgi:hypothetical protein
MPADGENPVQPIGEIEKARAINPGLFYDSG